MQSALTPPRHRLRTLLDAGAGAEALALIQRFDPAADDPELALMRADALMFAGRAAEAAAAYRPLTEARPGEYGPWWGLGCAHLALNAHGAAIPAFRRAAAIRPDLPAPRFNLATSLMMVGRMEEGTPILLDIARREPSLRRAALKELAVMLPGHPGSTTADVRAAREAWITGEREALRAAAVPPPRPAPPEGRRLRVGYVSAFFGSANYMKPVWGLINAHDRARFEIHMISDGRPPSAESGYRDHDDDRVHEVRGVPNDRLAGHLRRLGLDVLVDLNSYSLPARLPFFTLRPAPVQVAWFNSYAPGGVAEIGHLVGDGAVIRDGEEGDYGERLHRLPGTYLAFDVTYAVPAVAPPPVLRHGYLTFGSFCSLYKLTDTTLSTWAAILRAAPTARLRLRNGALGEVSNRDDLTGRMAALGVDPARVTLEGPADHHAFLSDYAEVDVALDAVPYNGGTTTTEALWQGVPVLATDGDRWAARTSASLLSAAGLGDWVLPDAGALVARAVFLANDAAAAGALLAPLRAGLRDALRRSPACDSAGLCRAMEELYVGLVREAASGAN
ncbi:hypothetical protein ACE7GA_16875 [Roseomonas sp. CCTCC AB2023176]|uniref:O-linked N-acetylglucosamine transferase, SPINDLY family protein n=1 Tax=Roseomonas sp. CCTCC AB2023176 TaxID=3342640 RepID=UPI0035DBECC5